METSLALTDVVNTLDESSFSSAFRDRAVEVANLGVLGEPVDRAGSLAAYSYLLESANGETLPLTAGGYLKPADVRALAAVMPAMRDWGREVGREIDVSPVRYFREYLKAIGLLRKYCGSLRTTRVGRNALNDPIALWEHFADTLVPVEPSFEADATVVVLVHIVTMGGWIDVDAVAQTLTALGWWHSDGSAISAVEVYEVWNNLWVVLGNVGEREDSSPVDRSISQAACAMIHDALFTEV